MNATTRNIVKVIAIVSLFVFGLLMLNTIRLYTSFKTDVGFLQFKQDIVHNPYWRVFFYIHVFSVSLCLLAGLTQFSNRLLLEQPTIHRFIGKVYVYSTLVINVPACLVLGIFSNGGILGQIGFVVQDFLWAYFTIAAIISIKKKEILKHKNFMVLSYAITTTALTFRLVKNLFYEKSGMPYHLFYGMDVWLSMIVNIGIAIGIIARRKALSTLPSNRNRIDKYDKRNQ